MIPGSGRSLGGGIGYPLQYSWSFLVAQMVKNLPAMWETWVQSLGDTGSFSGLGRSPGGGHGNPLQYSCLENPHGQRSLVGYSPRGHKESDMTEWLSTAQQKVRICNGWRKLLSLMASISWSWMETTDNLNIGWVWKNFNLLNIVLRSPFCSIPMPRSFQHNSTQRRNP